MAKRTHFSLLLFNIVVRNTAIMLILCINQSMYLYRRGASRQVVMADIGNNINNNRNNGIKRREVYDSGGINLS